MYNYFEASVQEDKCRTNSFFSWLVFGVLSVGDGIGFGFWAEPNHSNTRVGGGPREERDVREQGTAPAN